jgi:hypothetical protein
MSSTEWERAQGATRRGPVDGRPRAMRPAPSTVPGAAGQDVRPVGVAARGVNALEVIGAIVQDGEALTAVGYLTRISGLADGLLFTDARNHTEATARFTFQATARVTARAERPNVLSVTAVGSVRFFLAAAGGADFGTPQSFADGMRIATHAARLHNVLTVTGDEHARADIEGELRQQQVADFALDGRRYRLGRRDLRLRLEVTGPGTGTDRALARASFDVAGHLLAAG